MAQNLANFSLSPSKVDTFQKCPRQFYYNYIKQPFPPSEKSWFLIGNIAHKALEDFHGPTFLDGNWPRLMRKAFRDAVASHNAFKKIESGLITKSDLYTVKNMLKDYLQYLRQGAAVNIYSLEKLIKINVKGVPVGMKADRIDLRPGGGYTVIDYKTSQRPATKQEEITSVQIPSYGLWIRQNIDKNAKISGAYFYLRHMSSKKGVHSHEVTNEWMETAAAKYVDIYSQIQNGCAYTPQKNKFCGFCDYRLPCASNFGLK